MDVLGINIGEEGNSVEGNYEKTLTFVLFMFQERCKILCGMQEKKRDCEVVLSNNEGPISIVIM